MSISKLMVQTRKTADSAGSTRTGQSGWGPKAPTSGLGASSPGSFGEMLEESQTSRSERGTGSNSKVSKSKADHDEPQDGSVNPLSSSQVNVPAQNNVASSGDGNKSCSDDSEATSSDTATANTAQALAPDQTSPSNETAVPATLEKIAPAQPTVPKEAKAGTVPAVAAQTEKEAEKGAMPVVATKDQQSDKSAVKSDTPKASTDDTPVAAPSQTSQETAQEHFAEMKKKAHQLAEARVGGDHHDATNNTESPLPPLLGPDLRPDEAQRVIAATRAVVVPQEKPAVPDAPVAAMGVNVATGSTVNPTAEVAAPAQEVPSAEPTDPMEQMVLGLKSKMDPRTGKAEIRLDPPNLGAVKVSLSLESGTLTAQFESSSAMVRDLLKSNLTKLKSVLEGQGVAVDRLAVEAPQDAQGQGQSASFGSATHDGRSAGQYQQDPRSPQRPQSANDFASLFTQAQDAPLDLVA